MKSGLIIAGLGIVVATVILIVASMSGDGSLRGRLTLGGVYAVQPTGYRVVCFISKQAGAMDCMSLADAGR